MVIVLNINIPSKLVLNCVMRFKSTKVEHECQINHNMCHLVSLSHNIGSDLPIESKTPSYNFILANIV